jgi:hypothetical protein
VKPDGAPVEVADVLLEPTRLATRLRLLVKATHEHGRYCKRLGDRFLCVAQPGARECGRNDLAAEPDRVSLM